jgi:hypothetical protein
MQWYTAPLRVWEEKKNYYQVLLSLRFKCLKKNLHEILWTTSVSVQLKFHCHWVLRITLISFGNWTVGTYFIWFLLLNWLKETVSSSVGIHVIMFNFGRSYVRGIYTIQSQMIYYLLKIATQSSNPWIFAYRYTISRSSCLHSLISCTILHGDVKSANILLDDQHNAKIADSGASAQKSMDESGFIMLVQGTLAILTLRALSVSNWLRKVMSAVSE